MATTKRPSPPKLVDDMNVTAITEQKAEKPAPETKPPVTKSTASSATKSSVKATTAPSAKAEKAASPPSQKSPAPAVEEKTPVKEPIGPQEEHSELEPKKATRATATKAKAKSEAAPAEASSVPVQSAIGGTAKRSAKKSQPENSDLSEEEVNRQIAEAAYYLAEKRNFEPGHEAEDWETATAQVMARLGLSASS